MEQILGVSNSVDDMLLEKFPHKGSKELAAAMALDIVPLAVADGREKVVHARFQRCDARATIDVEIVLKRAMKLCMSPAHMSADMLEDGKLAIECSYAWPLSTVATFASLLSKISCVDASAFLKTMLSSPLPKHVRNRSLALRIQCSLLWELLVA